MRNVRFFGGSVLEMATCCDAQNLLLRCSLAWLRGVGETAELLEEQLFDEDGQLKQEVSVQLANTACYMKAFQAIFPMDTRLEEQERETFWPIIHGLARHGIYAVDDDGQSVNHAVLSHVAPFRKSSHIALLDALMRAQVSAVLTVPRVVRVVREICSVSAAHELPTDTEEAIMLWLHKVLDAVIFTHNREKIKMDPTWRSGVQVIAQPRTLMEAVTGGQSLAALLVFYQHLDFTFEDFHFQPTVLAPEQAIENTAIFSNFAQRKLPPHSFHIDPEVVVTQGTTPLLHTNVLALLARIFDYFEPLKKFELSTDSVDRKRNVSLKAASQEAVTSSCGSSQKRSISKHLLPLRRNLHSVNKGTGSISPIGHCRTSSCSPLLRTTGHALNPLTGRQDSHEDPSAERFTRKIAKVTKQLKKREGRGGVNERKRRRKEGRLKDAVNDVYPGTRSDARRKKTTPVYFTAELEKDASSIESSPDLKKSFTLSKQHTVASAYKAGLPIIEGGAGTAGLVSGPLEEEIHDTKPLFRGSMGDRVVQDVQTFCEVTQLSLPSEYSHILLYTPVSAGQRNDEFEHYLMRLVQLGTALNKDTNTWRWRLKERNNQSASASVCKYTLFLSSQPSATSLPSGIKEKRNEIVKDDNVTCRMVPLADNVPSFIPSPSNQGPCQRMQHSRKSSTLSARFSEVVTNELQERRRDIFRKRLKEKHKNIRDTYELTTEKQLDLTARCTEPLSPFIVHDGPECYVRPSAKSNRKLIRNALCHVCLAGEVNFSAKELALKELDASDALHFFILFKHIISFTFRALYSYSEEGKVGKIFGSGPRIVNGNMIDSFYKYNSGSKEFLKIHSHSLSLSVDAFTLKQEVWALRRKK